MGAFDSRSFDNWNDQITSEDEMKKDGPKHMGFQGTASLNDSYEKQAARLRVSKSSLLKEAVTLHLDEIKKRKPSY
jgi:hypothetical protein